MVKIKSIKGNQRISTQKLLQTIYDKIEAGETDFEIEASGQHDIGGAVWTMNKKGTLNFRVTNPGQRVGAMAMEGTRIVVEGSAPADVGWLNSGAEIIVKGDAGDTAAHCAAGGKVYIAGRVGTRSGALMKHDPKFEPPEFWVLKSTGSFSFEFMGGGIAVVCGYDCEESANILGNRSCVGMVGGVVYVRIKNGQKINGLASCVEQKKLNKFDKDFLKANIPVFLKQIEREELVKELSNLDEWIKIVPVEKSEKEKKITVAEFKNTDWFEGGLFGDLVEDDGSVYGLAEPDRARLRKPVWNSELCIGCNLCLNNCPQKAIEKEAQEYKSDDKICIGCGICKAVCPRKAWNMV